jgi:hypothetical protein
MFRLQMCFPVNAWSHFQTTPRREMENSRIPPMIRPHLGGSDTELSPSITILFRNITRDEVDIEIHVYPEYVQCRAPLGWRGKVIAPQNVPFLVEYW